MKRTSPQHAFVLLTTLILTFIPTATGRADDGFDAGLDATCRITAPDGGCGTGCVFAIDRGTVFLLTAGHVVEGASVATCEFWRAGHQSRPIAARVVAHVPAVDVAVCGIDVSEFGHAPPKVIPIAPVGFALKPGDTILSVGCARGAWATAWKGHLMDLRGGELWFQPPPAGGRSGSAILDGSGRFIVGVLVGRLQPQDGESIGIAISIAKVREGLTQCSAGNRPPMQFGSPDATFHQAASDTAGCFGGICRPPGGVSTPLYPTMPLVVSPQGGGSVDLGETNKKLDRIAELLDQMQHQRNLVPVTPPPAAQSTGSPPLAPMVLPSSSPTATADPRVSELHGLVQRLVGDRETLIDRIGERIDKVKEAGADSRLDIARQYAADLVREKLTDGSVGFSTGQLLAAALGLSGPISLAIGAGLWLIGRRIGSKVESGEPLLIQKIFERLADRLEAKKETS